MPAYLTPIYRGKCAWPTCHRDADRILFNGENAEVSRWCNSHSEKGLTEHNRRVVADERERLVTKTNEHARRRTDKERTDAE